MPCGSSGDAISELLSPKTAIPASSSAGRCIASVDRCILQQLAALLPGRDVIVIVTVTRWKVGGSEHERNLLTRIIDNNRQ